VSVHEGEGRLVKTFFSFIKASPFSPRVKKNDPQPISDLSSRNKNSLYVSEATETNHLFINSLVLSLLLGPQIRTVSTLLLPAVGGTRVVTSIARAANLLLAVVLLGEHNQGGFNHTTTEAEHKVESRFLLDVLGRCKKWTDEEGRKDQEIEKTKRTVRVQGEELKMDTREENKEI
jgi:hypothetical protein